MNILKQQWDKMIAAGVMPLFEMELPAEEWLLVNLAMTTKGIEFSFDSASNTVTFDGEIEVIHSNRYLLPFDEGYVSLDAYLDIIHSNMVEGYLIPNNLFV